MPVEPSTEWDDLSTFDYYKDSDDFPEDRVVVEPEVIVPAVNPANGGVIANPDNDGDNDADADIEEPIREVIPGVQRQFVPVGAPPRRSARLTKPPDPNWFKARTSDEDDHFESAEDSPNSSDSNLVFVNWTYDDYVKMEDSILKQKISDALLKEVNNFKEYGVFKEVHKRDIPPGKNILKGKWVIVEKKDESGQVARQVRDKVIKARWVAKGFTQIPGEDYFDTHAPVVDAIALRIILMLAVQFDLMIYRSDVPAAFLNGESKDDLYTIQMKGFESGPDWFNQVIKSWYGTKQGGHDWNVRLNKELVGVLKMKRLTNDPCIYMVGNFSDLSTLVIIAVYVDDFIDAWHPSAKAVAAPLIKHLEGVFKLKRKSRAGRFVGLVLDWKDDGSLFINQSGQTLELLEKFQMLDAKGSRVPMLSLPTKRQEGEDVCQEPFRSFVGGAMYIATHSRPDISLSVGAISRHMSSPAERHWTDVKTILRYLKDTPDVGLLYKKGDRKIRIRCYTDSDWGGCQETGVSTSGYALFMNDCLVDWRSAKQNSVATSTSAAELEAGSMGLTRLTWAVNLMDEMGVPLELPSSWLVDNQTAMKVTLNDKTVKRLKHEMIKIHALREKVADGLVAPEYVPTSEQVADGFTKPLTGAAFAKFVEQLGLVREPP